MIREAFQTLGNDLQALSMPDLFPILNLNLSKETSYVHLMTDGGSENKGELNGWINQSGVAINKIIAQKDVTFSNSQIEALNKIIKYQFLYHQEIHNLQELDEMMKSWISVYNSERPNKVGNYLLTPEEIYNGHNKDSVLSKEESRENRQKRTLENQNFDCGTCTI
ncbi:integrase core domain-containing protein [Leptospira ilyithenensis]|uniref:Integrase catalytic domain-containing protein n=1 Tax=Leptospira ilyithenensis TaxID=2484901 RepID=A0A4V3JWW2_9LEPT|nr:integrase core domain-containing protein [Leptospira ilyithenensis]TGN08713.1 hypothetical protein EHS11_13205 [Leptospira ilyithenensis]